MIRARRLVTAAACLTLAAAGLTACGDDSASSTTRAATSAATSTTALTAEQFRARADAICSSYNARNEALPTPTSPDTVGPYFAQAMPLAQQQLAELRALTPPTELKPTYDATLTVLQQTITELGDAQSRIADGEDPATVLTDIADRVNGLKAEADRRATELGLTVCGAGDTGTGTTTG